MIAFDQSRVGSLNLPSPEGVCEIGTLMTRCMGDAVLAANLLRRFDARLMQAVSEIERAVAESNCSEAARRVHSLKGEAGSLATTRIQHSAAALEQCLRSGRVAEVSEHVTALKTSCEQLRKTFPTILDSLTTRVNDKA
jgi:HPt (histidine-containing phosphotransfer) domain-containing protein